MHFENKVIWITGASSGIGAELARQFAQQKARMILTGRNEAALEAVQTDCLRTTDHCVVLSADMMRVDELDALTQKAIAVFGRIDVVVLNAGKSQRSLAGETNLQVYRDLMDLNFFAPVQITKSLLPHFAAHASGHIVAIGSVAGLMGFPMRTGYAATKHALKGFFETLQTENQIAGLHITIISPGRVNTPISMHALKGDGSLHGQMDEGQLKGIPVADCAHSIIKAVTRKRKHLIIAQNEKLLYWIWWFARPLYYRIARKKGLA